MLSGSIVTPYLTRAEKSFQDIIDGLESTIPGFSFNPEASFYGYEKISKFIRSFQENPPKNSAEFTDRWLQQTSKTPPSKKASSPSQEDWVEVDKEAISPLTTAGKWTVIDEEEASDSEPPMSLQDAIRSNLKEVVEAVSKATLSTLG